MQDVIEISGELREIVQIHGEAYVYCPESNDYRALAEVLTEAKYRGVARKWIFRGLVLTAIGMVVSMAWFVLGLADAIL